MIGYAQCFDFMASRPWGTRTPSHCPSQVHSGHHGDCQRIGAEAPSPSQEGVRRPCGRAQHHSLFRAFLVAQMGKNPPATQKTWVRSLGWEDPVEESMATHSSILAWRIAMKKGAWLATVHGVPKSQT